MSRAGLLRLIQDLKLEFMEVVRQHGLTPAEIDFAKRAVSLRLLADALAGDAATAAARGIGEEDFIADTLNQVPEAKAL